LELWTWKQVPLWQVLPWWRVVAMNLLGLAGRPLEALVQKVELEELMEVPVEDASLAVFDWLAAAEHGQLQPAYPGQHGWTLLWRGHPGPLALAL